MAMIPTESFLGDFLFEAHEIVDSIESGLLEIESAAGPERVGILEGVQRDLHTLKGNAGMMGLDEIQELAHTLEDQVGSLDLDRPVLGEFLTAIDRCRSLLEALKPGEGEEEQASAEPSLSGVRVSFGNLDALVEQLAEMVIFRNRLGDTIDQGRSEAETRRAKERWEEVGRAHAELAKTLENLRDEVMALRVVPLETLFGRLRRIVHDEGARLGKQVAFEVVGGQTPIDRALLEFALEALGHLVRNSVVHGVEDPEGRRRAGKGEVGLVRVSAQIASGEVRIDVVDDGAGIDRHALRAVAQERGLSGEDQGGLFSLLSQPGLTTRGQADMSSGRGMGLTAVREAVRRQGGRVEVDSREGVGTRFRLTLPSRVSITWALLLRADGEDYALPLPAIIESLPLEDGEGHRVNNAGVFRWRGSVLSLLDLGCAFGTSEELRERGYVVVIELEGRFRGLVVDELIGVREVVVKGLDPVLGSPGGVFGSTILGDGRAILILDPVSLMHASPFLEKSA